MSSARMTRSSRRGGPELVALPSDFTPAKLRAKLRADSVPTSQPLEEVTNQEPKTLSFSPKKSAPAAAASAPVKPAETSTYEQADDAANVTAPQTPEAASAADDVMLEVTPAPEPTQQGELSDVERLLAEPTPRLTPQTMAKWAQIAAEEARDSPADDRWTIDRQRNSCPEATSEPEYRAPVAMKSKVVAGENFEPRSIRQLKKQIKAEYAKQASGSGEGDSDDEEDAQPSSATKAAAAALSDALDGLTIAPLRGVPSAQGQHLRFADDGAAVASPAKAPQPARDVPTVAECPEMEGDLEQYGDEQGEVSEEEAAEPVNPGAPLRGLPAAQGSHVRFEAE